MRNALRTTMLHSAYALVAFPLSIVGFVLVVTLGSVGAGLIITVIGIPILAGMLLAASGLALGDRVQLRTLMGLAPATPRYKPPADRAWARILTPLTDPQRWLDAIFQVVRLPLGITSFTIVVVW